MNVLPKTPSTLLVHFCSRSHTINSHKKHFPRFNNAKQHFQVVKNISKNFIIWNSEVNIIIIRMGTLMYNSIHIQIQVVKFRYLKKKDEDHYYNYNQPWIFKRLDKSANKKQAIGAFLLYKNSEQPLLNKESKGEKTEALVRWRHIIRLRA